MSVFCETALTPCKGNVVELLKTQKGQIQKLAAIADLQLSPYPEAKGADR